MASAPRKILRAVKAEGFSTPGMNLPEAEAACITDRPSRAGPRERDGKNGRLIESRDGEETTRDRGLPFILKNANFTAVSWI